MLEINRGAEGDGARVVGEFRGRAAYGEFRGRAAFILKIMKLLQDLQKGREARTVLEESRCYVEDGVDRGQC